MGWLIALGIFLLLALFNLWLGIQERKLNNGKDMPGVFPL